MEWLQEHIWPTEGRWVSPEFVQDGASLAIAEMIRGGTTCFNDVYFFPEQTAEAAVSAGIRACIGLVVIQVPTGWAATEEEYLSRAVDVHEALEGVPSMTTAISPHAPYTVSDKGLGRVGQLAEDWDVRIHMHVHETAAEVEEFVASRGTRPLEHLDRLGLLGPRMLAVHMTQLVQAEIERVAESGSHVIHSPESNLKLVSGFCPVDALRRAGANVALGTDGAASNNDLDMFGEMKTAALVGKWVAGSSSAHSAYETLRMATLCGAEALGLSSEIGSVEKGKAADLTAIDLSMVETQPVFDPISQIVYAAGRGQVTDVWVAGRQVLENRQLMTIDEQAVVARAEEWRRKIQA
jgi:5-methylthioadenosine/S-adenosylhomocysteine deaminase